MKEEMWMPAMLYVKSKSARPLLKQAAKSSLTVTNDQISFFDTSAIVICFFFVTNISFADWFQDLILFEQILIPLDIAHAKVELFRVNER